MRERQLDCLGRTDHACRHPLLDNDQVTVHTDSGSNALRMRPGIGATAGVVQHSELRFSRLAIDQPTVIVVHHGSKTLHAEGREWQVGAGDAIAIAGGATLDVTNRLGGNGRYEARWLILDAKLVQRAERQLPRINKSNAIDGASTIRGLEPEFCAALARAFDAITAPLPDPIAQHRLAEVLAWLSLRGLRFPPMQAPSLATRVRRLFEPAPTERWTTALAARQLAMGEATLRRRLATEDTTVGTLLADVRMTSALLLLHSTGLPVNRIALDVGYESASRFAIRFRARFGCAPSAIRTRRMEAANIT